MSNLVTIPKAPVPTKYRFGQRPSTSFRAKFCLTSRRDSDGFCYPRFFKFFPPTKRAQQCGKTSGVVARPGKRERKRREEVKERGYAILGCFNLKPDKKVKRRARRGALRPGKRRFGKSVVDRETGFDQYGKRFFHTISEHGDPDLSDDEDRTALEPFAREHFVPAQNNFQEENKSDEEIAARPWAPPIVLSLPEVSAVRRVLEAREGPAMIPYRPTFGKIPEEAGETSSSTGHYVAPGPSVLNPPSTTPEWITWSMCTKKATGHEWKENEMMGCYQCSFCKKRVFPP